MNKKGLSKIQKDTLDRMEEGKSYSAHDLQVTLNTLHSLHNRNLIELLPKEVGWIWFPRTVLQFRKVAE